MKTLSILFDLDGTLIDSVGLIVKSYQHTLRVHRDQEIDAQVFLTGLGVPLADQFREFTDDEAEVDAMIATYRQHNLAHHDREIRAYDGIEDLLRTLHSQGHSIGVVTNKIRSTALRGLEVSALSDYVSVVIGSGCVTRSKPHPEGIHNALKMLATSRASAQCRTDRDTTQPLFIGDSPIDLQAGRAAECHTVAVGWGPFPHSLLRAEAPNSWLEQPSDLLAHVAAATQE